MKIWTLLCFVFCLICYFGCGIDSVPDSISIDMKVADIEVLRHSRRDVKIVMYGLHRYQCVEIFGNVSYRQEGNTIHVAPRVGESPGDCPDLSETRTELWLTGLGIGVEYTILGYTREEYSYAGGYGYGTEWLVFRLEADRIVIVRKSLNTNHKFQNRVTL